MILTPKSTKEHKQHLFDKQGGLCPLCGLPLENWNSANLDHNHATGRCRGLLHPLCNSVLEGKVIGLMYRAGLKGKVDFADVLENLANYWRQDYNDQPIHGSFVRDEAAKFARLTKEKMITALVKEGADVDKTYSKDDLIEIYKAEYRKILAS